MKKQSFILKNEQWRDIYNFDKYQISNYGRCKNIKTGLILSQRKVSQNYIAYVILDNQGIAKNKRAHRLVSQAFIINHNNKKFVNHKNGIRNDNRVLNLEWVTSKENSIHAWENLTNQAKVKNNCSELGKRTAKNNMRYKIRYTQQQVLEIKEAIKTMTRKEVIRTYELASTTFYRIKNGTYTTKDKLCHNK